MERIPFSLKPGDPEAGHALQRVLRIVSAARDDEVFGEEVGHVVTEIAGDGDRDQIAQRVAWLVVIVAAAVATLVEEGDDGDVADRLCDIGRQIETRLETLVASELVDG